MDFFFFFFWRPTLPPVFGWGVQATHEEASERERVREWQFQSVLSQWGRLWVEKKVATSNLSTESSLVIYNNDVNSLLIFFYYML